MTKLTEHIVTVSRFARITDSSDILRRRHCYKVERYSILICEKLKLPSKAIKVVKIASMLHDIGKIGIDLNIIRKPAKLNAAERDQVRMHSEIGANIVEQLGLLGDAASVIRYHHACFGGGGYPDPEMSGERIPIGSRIVFVADAFDAMTSDRPYRKAISIGLAISELKRCSGQQFDPQVVDAFLETLA